MPDLDAQVDHIEDDVLRLIFLSCHPSLTPESRAALTLRLVGGLTTSEIARGFLATESTMGQRISRAKKTLAEAPRRLRAADRRGAGQAARRRDGRDLPDLQRGVRRDRRRATGCGPTWRTRAMRLARMLADLAPDEPEVLGLQALLEIQGSRMQRAARRARCAGAAGGAGPDALGPAADPARPGRAPAGRAARRAREAGREVLPAGVDRRAARPRRAGRGHRLAPDRDAVRRPGRGRAGTGRRGQPCRRARPGVRPGRRAAPCSTALDADALGDSPLVPSVRGDLLERAGLHAEAAAAFTEAAGAHPERGRAHGAAAASRRESGSRVEIRLNCSTHVVSPRQSSVA